MRLINSTRTGGGIEQSVIHPGAHFNIRELEALVFPLTVVNCVKNSYMEPLQSTQSGGMRRQSFEVLLKEVSSPHGASSNILLPRRLVARPPTPLSEPAHRYPLNPVFLDTRRTAVAKHVFPFTLMVREQKEIVAWCSIASQPASDSGNHDAAACLRRSSRESPSSCLHRYHTDH